MPKLRTLQSRLLPAKDMRLAPAPAATVKRKRGSAGVADRERIRRRDAGLCQACAAKGATSLGSDVDHKVPLWAGGSDEDSNKWLLCKPCHDAKTAHEAERRSVGNSVDP